MKTLEQTFNDCYESIWSGTDSEKTVLCNGSYLLDVMGKSTNIKKVDTVMIDKLRKRMRKDENSPSTINRKLAVLSTILTFAERRNYIVRKPYIYREKTTAGRIRTINKGEEAAILSYFGEGDRELYDLTQVGIDTGLRMGELLGLEPVLIRGENIFIPADLAKSKKNRWVPMTSRVTSILSSRLKQEFLFDQYRYKQVNYKWNLMKKAIDITDKEFVPHAMRHTFCSRLADKGVSPLVIMELAGHSSLEITKRYVHMDENGLKAAVSLLEEQ